MKKIYERPLLVKRQKLSRVTAILCTPSNPCP